MTATKIEIDCSTGEQKVIPLTAEEIAQREADNQAYLERVEAQKAEAKAQAEAKASALAKLTALGLSEDEAKAIVG